MSKYAPVVPIHLAQKLWDYDPKLFGDYHLLLAHDVMEEAKTPWYGDLYAKVWKKFPTANIFMDNSVVELGDAVEFTWVLSAARAARANIAVIPDAYRDGLGTIKKLHETFDKYGGKDIQDFLKEGEDKVLAPEFDRSLMFVPQGPALHDFVRCLEEVRQYSDSVKWIGIPRVAAEQLGTRRELVQIANTICPWADLHLLGFSDNVVDDIFCSRMCEVEGIDSAVPVRAGQNRQVFLLSRSDYGKREDFWTREHAVIEDETISNIEDIRDWVRYDL